MIEDYKWLLLAKLIENNNLKDGLELIINMYPQTNRFKEIYSDLDSGKDIKEILKKNKFEKQLAFYCQYIPLNIAISILIKKKENKEKIVKESLGKLFYQIVLLIAANLILSLFSHVVLPNMVDSLTIENETTMRLLKTFKIINVFRVAIIVVIVLLMITVIYIIIAKRENYCWMFLHRYKLDNFLKIIATYQLVNDLLLLIKAGIPLINSLEIIRLNKEKPLESLLAYHFNEALNQGLNFQESINKEFFDQQFASVCLYSLSQGSFLTSLQDYSLIIESKFTHLVKKGTNMITSISYMFVLIVIVLSYEVLLLPLEMLENL